MASILEEFAYGNVSPGEQYYRRDSQFGESLKDPPITNINTRPLYIVSPQDNDNFSPSDPWEDCIVYSAKKAICQAVLLPVPKVEVCEIPYSELEGIVSKRRAGKIGSSYK